jgi:hypothetical protein
MTLDGMRCDDASMANTLHTWEEETAKAIWYSGLQYQSVCTIILAEQDISFTRTGPRRIGTGIKGIRVHCNRTQDRRERGKLD